MSKKIIYLIYISLLVFTNIYAVAQNAEPDVALTTQQVAPKPKNCSEPQYRQLDFWVGDWSLEWTNADGSKSTGSNNITRAPYGNCVITETFDGAPSMQFKGMSVSTYDKFSGKWRQTWVDDQGGYYALSGGPNPDGTFTLTNTRLSDKAPHSRMVWSEITSDSLVWSWQGHMVGETEWKDQWVIRYTRNK